MRKVLGCCVGWRSLIVLSCLYCFVHFMSCKMKSFIVFGIINWRGIKARREISLILLRTKSGFIKPNQSPARSEWMQSQNLPCHIVWLIVPFWGFGMSPQKCGTVCFGLCPSVFSPRPLCVRLRQRHFTHGRQQLNIVFYVSACQGRWIFIACSELKADKQPYHMICLINGPHQQPIWLLVNYIWVWMGESECVCVCLRPEYVTISMLICVWGLRRETTEGFRLCCSLSRWIVDVFYSL